MEEIIQHKKFPYGLLKSKILFLIQLFLLRSRSKIMILNTATIILP